MTTEFSRGDTYGPNDSGIWTSGVHMKFALPNCKPEFWGNNIECYGQTQNLAETLRDQIVDHLNIIDDQTEQISELRKIILGMRSNVAVALRKADAFDKMSSAFDVYFNVDRDKAAGDRLLMSVIAAIREIKVIKADKFEEHRHLFADAARSKGFRTWFYSDHHRMKYQNDHPAYLCAKEAWDFLNNSTKG